MAALESLDAVVVVDEMDHPPPDASDRQPRRVARYIYSNSCSKIRTCWRLQLDGKYSFLDGLVSSGMCDQDKRPYSLWEYYDKLPYMEITARRGSDRIGLI